MRYLKRFNESLVNQDEIDNICRRYSIKNYTINDDDSVYVDGSVNLSNKGLTKLPLNFSIVTESFYCSDNLLITLDGSPKLVGDFDCSNNKLTSLIGGPDEVQYRFDCSYNKLKSLEGCPEIINKLIGRINCNGNEITSLMGCPKIIGSINISYNHLTSLEGGPIETGDFNCSCNHITNLEHSPNKVRGHFDCTSNLKLTSLMGFPDSITGGLWCEDTPVYEIWKLFSPNMRFLEKINHIYTDLHLGDGWTIQGDVLEQIAEELNVKLTTGWKYQLEKVGYKII